MISLRKINIIIFLSLVFQHIAVSQTYDSITLDEGKSLAIKRCYLCCGLNVKHDSNAREAFKGLLDNDSNHCITFITGYLIGDTIQKIVEHIWLHVKYRPIDFYDNSEMTITYKYSHSKLIEADDMNLGASYEYFFKNDSLIVKRIAIDDLGYFSLEADEALIYSKEDENMILNSEAFIKRRH